MEVYGRIMLLVLATLILPSSLAITLTEIMYNPPSYDYYTEYLEIYNPSNNPINLSNYKICGDDLETGYIDNITGALNKNTNYILAPDQYAIITDGGTGTKVYRNFNVSNQSLALHVDTSSICGELNNTGGTIVIQNSTHIIQTLNYNATSDADNTNNSLQLINNSWLATLPTPGYANQFVNTTSTGLKLEVCIGGDCDADIAIKDFEYDKLFKITNLDHVTNQTENISLTFYYNITFNNSIIKEEDILITGLNSYKTTDTGSWTPEYLGNYTICGQITNSSVNDTSEYNKDCKQIKIVNNPIQIISQPTHAKFGDFKTLHIELNTTNYPYNETTFLLYGDAKQVISNLDGTGVTANQYTSPTAVNIQSLIPGTIYNTVIPFFIKPNCDSYYNNGKYHYKLRVFTPSNQKFLDYPLSITLTGKNSFLCPLTDRETITDEENLVFQITSYSAQIRAGRNATTLVFLQNNEDIAQEFKLYSYIYSKESIANIGGWTPNTKIITLDPGELKYITLKNTIKQNISSGYYTLKARIAYGDYKITESREIKILENNQLQDVQINTTPPEDTQEKTKQTTLYSTETNDYIHWIIMAITFGITSVLLILIRD